MEQEEQNQKNEELTEEEFQQVVDVFRILLQWDRERKKGEVKAIFTSKPDSD